MFKIFLSTKSRRQIKRANENLKERIRGAILEIAEDPWHKGTIKVQGFENIRRKRVGKYRILYIVDKQREEVLIVKIEKRSETTYRVK